MASLLGNFPKKADTPIGALSENTISATAISVSLQSCPVKAGEYLLVDTGYNRMIQRRPEPAAIQKLPVVGRLVSLEIEEMPYRMLILLRATRVDP